MRTSIVTSSRCNVWFAPIARRHSLSLRRGRRAPLQSSHDSDRFGRFSVKRYAWRARSTSAKLAPDHIEEGVPNESFWRDTFITVEACTSEKVLQLYEYWQRLRGSRSMPYAISARTG